MLGRYRLYESIFFICCRKIDIVKWEHEIEVHTVIWKKPCFLFFLAEAIRPFAVLSELTRLPYDLCLFFNALRSTAFYYRMRWVSALAIFYSPLGSLVDVLIQFEDILAWHHFNNLRSSRILLWTRFRHKSTKVLRYTYWDPALCSKNANIEVLFVQANLTKFLSFFVQEWANERANGWVTHCDEWYKLRDKLNEDEQLDCTGYSGTNQGWVVTTALVA